MEILLFVLLSLFVAILSGFLAFFYEARYAERWGGFGIFLSFIALIVVILEGIRAHPGLLFPCVALVCVIIGAVTGRFAGFIFLVSTASRKQS